MYSGLIKFYSEVKLQKGVKKTLVVNVDTRENFFLSNEVLEYVMQASEKNMSRDEFLACFLDDEDRAYMSSVVDKLDEKHMLVDSMPPLNNKRISISLDMTNRCNLSCVHCCVGANDCGFNDELDSDSMKKMLGKIAKYNPYGVSISGGEPLVRKDFKELINWFRDQYSGKMDIMTNGTLIDTDMAQFLAKHFQAVSISLDGCDEESCSLIRGKGTFQSAIKGIKLLQKAGLEDITVSMTLCKENEHLRRNFQQLCDELKVGHVFRKLDVSDRLIKLGNPIHPVDPEPVMTDDKFKEYRKKYLADNLHKIQPETLSCQGARREFQIDYRGFLYPCAACMDDEFFMADMKEVEDFTKFFEQETFKESAGYKCFMSYMPYNYEECKDCNKNLMCYTCVRTLIDSKKEGVFRSKCQNYGRIYDMIWEE